MTLDTRNLIQARNKGFNDSQIIESVEKNFPDLALNIKKARDQGFDDSKILESVIRTQGRERRIESERQTAEQLQTIGLEQPVPSREDLRIEEQMTEQGPRGVSQVASGALEGALGIPGNVVGIAETLNRLLPQEPSFLSREPNELQKAVRGGLESLPKTEDIRGFQERTAPRLTPQTPEERVARKGGEFAGSSAIFGPSQIVPGFVSGMAAEATKEAGGGAVAQFFASVAGGLTASGLQNWVKNPKALNQFVDDLYSDARAAKKPGEWFDNRGVKQGLTEIVEDIDIGIVSKSEEPVRAFTQKAINKMGQGANTEIDTLERLIRNVREDMRSLNPFTDRNTMRLFKGVEEKLIDGVKQHGAENPTWSKLFMQADAAYAAVNKTGFIQNMLPKSFNLKKLEPATMILTGLFSPAVAKGIALKSAGSSVIRLVQRVNSSALRPYYQSVLKNASAGNKGATVKAMLKFNEEVKKNPELFEDVETEES